MSSPPVSRDAAPPGESGVATELHAFLAGANADWPRGKRGAASGPTTGGSQQGPSQEEAQNLARTALYLLRNMPLCKEAVLQYMCGIFDTSARQHVANLKGEGPSSDSYQAQEDITIGEIHTALSGFIVSNADAWAPLISSWSLDLLGTLSRRYADETVFPHDAGLNDMLQIWVACRATRTLIDIAMHCFSCVTNTDSVSALLDMSVKHSPHFDWVVAHIGGCFPTLIITRVLQCGLDDFHAYERSNREQAPKLKSVVGILSYLAGSHFGEIRDAFAHLFVTTFGELNSSAASDGEKMSAVPFLLQMASMSRVLCRALMSGVLPTLDPDKLQALSQCAKVWIGSRYFGSERALITLLVHLIMQSEEGESHALQLLLKFATEDSPVQLVCLQLTEQLLQELSRLVHTLGETRSSLSDDIPILSSLSGGPALEYLQASLVLAHPHRTRCSARLLSLLALYQGPAILASTIASVLGHECDVSVISQLMCGSEATYPKALLDGVSQVVCDPNSTPLSWWNLVQLLEQDVSRGAHGAVQDSLGIVADKMTNPDLCLLVVNAAIMTGVPERIEVSQLIKLCHKGVGYLFASLQEDNPDMKAISCNQAVTLLVQCSQRPPGKSAILRLLLESAVGSTSLDLAPDHSSLFGGTTSSSTSPENIPASIWQPSLSESNLQHGLTPSPAFHAGVIGHGLRQRVKKVSLPQSLVVSNIQRLLDAINACIDLSPEAVTQTALLLVELVSPDVMFNGLPWPEEEFARVTIERDLAIYHAFQDRPLLWELLRMLASNLPALCYCSVLLRAIMATLLSYWSATQDDRASDSPLQMDATLQLLDVMFLGHLLPVPLAYVGDILPYLAPHEVAAILRDVWAYMRDNVPAPPSIFVRDPNTGHLWRDVASVPLDRQYVTRLRLIFLANMDRLGEFYSHLFPTGLDESDSDCVPYCEIGSDSEGDLEIISEA